VVLGPVLDMRQLQAQQEPARARWDAFSSSFGYLTQTVGPPYSFPFHSLADSSFVPFCHPLGIFASHFHAVDPCARCSSAPARWQTPPQNHLCSLFVFSLCGSLVAGHIEIGDEWWLVKYAKEAA
jgi:hypothetical protein